MLTILVYFLLLFLGEEVLFPIDYTDNFSLKKIPWELRIFKEKNDLEMQ